MSLPVLQLDKKKSVFKEEVIKILPEGGNLNLKCCL